MRLEVIQVPGFDDQTISFKYGIFSRTVMTDRIGPIITNMEPDSGAVVPAGSVVLEADIFDVSSGYSTKLSDMEKEGAQAEAQPGWVALEVLGNIIPGDDESVTWTAIENGWNLRYENSFTTDDVICIPWRIIAQDQAGAQTIEERLAESEDVCADSITMDGADPRLERDNSERLPEMRTNDDFELTLKSRTGDSWSSSAAEDKRWRTSGTGKDIKPADVERENRKSVLVVFKEKGGLDVSSVDASDFSVDGQTPTSVTVVDVIEDSKENPSSSDRRAQEVFLTMGSNLPSNGKNSDGAKIEVTLTGTVRDIAGNSAGSGTVPLADGIPPAITVLVDDADLFAQKKVTVEVAVDETLKEAPKLLVYRSKLAATVEGDIVLRMDSTGARDYEKVVDISKGSTVPMAKDASLINIAVKATDVASNTDTKGSTSDWSDSGAITFQLDPELNDSLEPAFTVAGKQIFEGKILNSNSEVGLDDAEVEVVDPLLITVDFGRECGQADRLDDRDKAGCQDGGEEKEYRGDTHKTVELSGVAVDVDLDDGTSAEPEFVMSSSDSIVYTLSIRNPPVGVYTLSFKATDEAGNVSLTSGNTAAETIESEFTVKAAVPTELQLSPGWNLISLPFQPANPGLNSILPSTHPASLVMSYDNASGLWVVSRRDAETGMFTGDVMQLVATTAYFVFTDSLDPIKLIRPGLATAAAAPAIPNAIAVKAGWNLLPVLTYQSPLPGVPPGSGGVSADDYLGALRNAQGDHAWLRALIWDTSSQTWDSVAPGDTVTLSAGDTNVCTGEILGADAVAGGNEPCQADQDDNYNEGQDEMMVNPDFDDAAETGPDSMAMVVDPGFNGDDTVVMERHLPLGSGLWVWSTIDSVIFPTS